MNKEDLQKLAEVVEELSEKVGEILDGREFNICMNVVATVAAGVISVIPPEDRMDAMKELFGVIAARVAINSLDKILEDMDADEDQDEENHTVQ